MGWWWKLTVEWPGALGDWLWKYLVTMPVASLKEMTLRRIFTILAMAVLVTMFAQIAAGDLAYLLAGDMLTYLEAATIVWLLGVRGRGLDTIRALGRVVKGTLVRLRKTVPAPKRAAVRRCVRSQARRVRRSGGARRGKDRPGVRVSRAYPPAAYAPSTPGAAVRPRPPRRYRQS
jgi:hypothetical protein